MSHAPQTIAGKLAGVALIAAAVLVGARGCGGVTDTRVGARDAATKATCDRYQACSLIGTGAANGYADLASCQIAWRANWDMYWPVADCQGHIDQASLNVCLDRINSTQCTSFLDFLSTLGICGKANVCSAGAPPDAGGQ
jgi:hypothetical protein